jgi:hypothetical protein
MLPDDRMELLRPTVAMRFLNLLGNVFFAKTLSFLLDTRLGDSLCGTKLFARHDWPRFRQWTRGFGDFDPFGDFGAPFPRRGPRPRDHRRADPLPAAHLRRDQHPAVPGRPPPPADDPAGRRLRQARTQGLAERGSVRGRTDGRGYW